MSIRSSMHTIGANMLQTLMNADGGGYRGVTILRAGGLRAASQLERPAGGGKSRCQFTRHGRLRCRRRINHAADSPLD